LRKAIFSLFVHSFSFATGGQKTVPKIGCSAAVTASSGCSGGLVVYRNVVLSVAERRSSEMKK
jgi:hypothetical protein